MARQQRGLRTRLREELYTYCAFCIAVSALPALALSYVVVRISNHLWLKLLSSKHPSLEFIRTNTVRTLLDTHRNQGIINVLLCIRGTLDVDEIKQKLQQHVIDRRDAQGELMFPRLRHVLVSSWGNYAWDSSIPFRLENHFIVSNGVYRGRPVSDNNIQDYVSEIISKYFLTDQPPWQYIVIPCVSAEPKYYILSRVHHLLLTGKKSLNIGDFLLVEQLPANRVIEQREYHQRSPLAKLFPAPSAIPELWERVNETLSNLWNEFICEYDPSESPETLKSLPGVFHVAGIVLMSATNALREATKKRFIDRDQQPTTVTSLLSAVHRECKKRNLTIPKIIISPLVTMDPRKWPKRIFGATYSTTQMVLKLPSIIRDEVVAINELRTIGRVKKPNTYTWKYGDIGQLCVKATGEALRAISEAYKAPAYFWTDTIRADDGKRHMLQTISLCGRKVTSWSRPVPRAGMERAARALGVSSTDIALFAATEALRSFFEQAQTEIPESILITARAASEDFLYTFAEGNGKNYKKSQTGGMVCLSLPVGATPRRIAAVVQEACQRQGTLAAAWAAQARCGALTGSVPSPLARLTMNVLSRKYAVSYAEINSPVDTRQRTTLWGKTVDYVVYWRPPQANISMSLTVMQYADTVRLTVMADARLSPSHVIPASRWPVVVEKLVNKVDQEIARITAQGQLPLGQVPPKKPSKEDLEPKNVEESSRVAESSRVGESSRKGETSHVGLSSRIAESSHVSESSQLGKSSHVSESKRVAESSYVLESSHVDKSCHVGEASHISESSHVGEPSHVSESSHVGEPSHVSESSHEGESSHIGEASNVDESTHVSETSHLGESSEVSESKHGGEFSHKTESKLEVMSKNKGETSQTHSSSQSIEIETIPGTSQSLMPPSPVSVSPPPIRKPAMEE